METTAAPSPTSASPAMTVLAVCGTIMLVLADAVGFRTDATETFFILATLLGWGFLVWATVVGAVGVVQVVRRVTDRRPPARRDVVLLLAGFVVIIATMAAYPLAGSGAGLA